MTGSERDQMGESCRVQRIAIVDVRGNGFGKREEFVHWRFISPGFNNEEAAVWYPAGNRPLLSLWAIDASHSIVV
jgi:hypothetical protein